MENLAWTYRKQGLREQAKKLFLAPFSGRLKLLFYFFPLLMRSLFFSEPLAGPARKVHEPSSEPALGPGMHIINVIVISPLIFNYYKTTASDSD